MVLGTIATDISDALATDPPARRVFETLAPGHRRAYLRWIDDARQAATRKRRIAGMLEHLNQGRANRSNGEG